MHAVVTARTLIESYRLLPHPEGGFYRESYRSSGTIPAASLPHHGGDRAFATAIHFLLTEGQVSRLHRLKSDEMWHFSLGGPLTIVEISPDGRLAQTSLGADVAAGERVQHVVPAGTWFGAFPNPGTAFSFVGCIVAPGFDFADFEMGDRKILLQAFPHARIEIEKLTPPSRADERAF